MSNQNSSTSTSNGENKGRRDFLSAAATVTMAGGLAASYGTLGTMAARMLYPSRSSSNGWVFVVDVASTHKGDSWVFETPIGAKIVLARQEDRGDVSDFVAFSSVCPHLGCQVIGNCRTIDFSAPATMVFLIATGKRRGGLRWRPVNDCHAIP